MMPIMATINPLLRRFFKNRSRIKPVIEIKVIKMADKSIIQDQPSPVSRPLCRSFMTATIPIFVSVKW